MGREFICGFLPDISFQIQRTAGADAGVIVQIMENSEDKAVFCVPAGSVAQETVIDPCNDLPAEQCNGA